MPLLLLVLFVVVPVLELWVIIQVGQTIGVLPTLALLLAGAVVGTWLFRREGRRTWAALREAIAEHRVPAREVADGALVVLGGAFLLTPGFVTDAIGVLCLLPPTRALVRAALTRVVLRRLVPPVPGWRYSGPGQPGPRRTPPDGRTIDGTTDES